jgi:hypothetical protein
MSDAPVEQSSSRRRAMMAAVIGNETALEN